MKLNIREYITVVLGYVRVILGYSGIPGLLVEENNLSYHLGIYIYIHM